jgi:hypothetical protein
MKVSAPLSPLITDARAQRAAEHLVPNVKTIYEPDPIPPIIVKTVWMLYAPFSPRVSYTSRLGGQAIRVLFVNEFIAVPYIGPFMFICIDSSYL